MAGTGDIRVQVSRHDMVKTNLGSWSTDLNTTTSARLVEGNMTIPDGTAFIRLAFRCSENVTEAFFGNPRILRRMTGKLIVDGSIIAAHLTANAIQTAHLDAGVVTSQKLAIGFGGNLLVNSDWAVVVDGTANPKTVKHWYLNLNGQTAAEVSVIRREAGGDWAGPESPVLEIAQTSTKSTGFVDVRCFPPKDNSGARGNGWPVKPGDWIEVSVQLSAHRCRGELYIEWRNAAGVLLGSTPAVTLQNDMGETRNPDSWTRIWTKGAAPANAAFANLMLRKKGTISGTNS
ncbi:hypothetical protein H5395_16795 [Paracoccus sp. MC1854]|uniref:hypothetical protein n=1 Tax=Paracoccus sp. MC1854 TaxID=2760306 RepID=UPI001601B5BB|nr:hypothetical protein [Paracoccus sp. MC1854]MBB1493132.1 hypothetical protein [Paracoccus sp. MC1854]